MFSILCVKRSGFCCATAVCGLLAVLLTGCWEAGQLEEKEESDGQGDLQVMEAGIGGNIGREGRQDDADGGCSEEDRSEFIHKPNRKFIGELSACSRETWANEAKNLGCIQNAMPSLSDDCANCFVDMASCAKENCKMPCMFDSAGEKCLKCANSNCQAALVRCSGVAISDLP